MKEKTNEKKIKEKTNEKKINKRKKYRILQFFCEFFLKIRH